jgi:hypothetical protein
MPKPENLQLDDLYEGQRISFAPHTVGICHSDFGLMAECVALVERIGDALIAELSDGRRYEVQRRGEVSLYTLCAPAE